MEHQVLRLIAVLPHRTLSIKMIQSNYWMGLVRHAHELVGFLSDSSRPIGAYSGNTEATILA